MLFYPTCVLWYPIFRNPWGTRYPICQNHNANTAVNITVITKGFFVSFEIYFN